MWLGSNPGPRSPSVYFLDARAEMFNIRLVPKMFNIRCLTSEPNEKEKKANVHLGQVRHAFARNFESEGNLRKRKKYNFWRRRGSLRANLSVLISVWNLVKPSMFTTQCTSSSSSISSISYMCSTACCHLLCTCNYILL